MARAKPPPEKQAAVDSLKQWTVGLPECIFLFGADLGHASEKLREMDRTLHMGLGSALAPTPPHWVHVDALAFGRRMVTNGEYQRFLEYAMDGPAAGKARVYDQSEIWDEVWNGQNLRIDRVKTSATRSDGVVEEVEEFYGDATNFVDAYVSSIRQETVRLLASEDPLSPDAPPREKETRFFLTKKSGGTVQRVELRRGDVIHRLFAFIKLKLKDAILPEDADDRALITEKERKAIEPYGDDVGKVVEDIQGVITRLRKKYSEHVDVRFRQRFASGKHRVETILFLERFWEELEKGPNPERVPLHRVLYPRFWPSPEGKRKAGFVRRRGKHVPWEDLPVVGISLYEAMGYAIWLATVTGAGVTLPNEAEYERASSWPVTAGLVEGRRVDLDPREKDLLPWQRENERAFHSFFGRVGEKMEDYFAADRAAYEKLLEETSRKVPKRGRIYQTEGFGWQWTIDRLDEGEIRYSRFQDPGYRRFEGKPCRLADDPSKGAEVFEYRPNSKIDSSHYVLKGSPDVLGGPGITTRRYSAFPLRGYPNIGMRIIVKEPEGSMVG